MGIILFTVLTQGILTPRADRGSLVGWHLLVINDGIFQDIGVISSMMLDRGHWANTPRWRISSR